MHRGQLLFRFKTSETSTPPEREPEGRSSAGSQAQRLPSKWLEGLREREGFGGAGQWEKKAASDSSAAGGFNPGTGQRCPVSPKVSLKTVTWTRTKSHASLTQQVLAPCCLRMRDTAMHQLGHTLRRSKRGVRVWSQACNYQTCQL